MLNRLFRRVHFAHAILFGDQRLEYYWSAGETGWVTDVMIRSPQSLDRL
ncbi:MAG: hypothetical protein IT427_10910 [Pirellulales bacterium]|nr:hypothetical protein [Pirellulales bacterium]